MFGQHFLGHGVSGCKFYSTQIAMAFGVISMLFDQGEIDLGMEMLVTIVGMALLIIKSIWGAVMSK